MNFSKIVNGLTVEASFDDKELETVYLPLLSKLSEMQKRKKRRIVVFLAAPPGAGKTTLSLFLQYLSENTEGITPIIAVGMDGFHRYEEYLVSHTVEHDGINIPMVKIKGAPITFDLEKLTGKIKAVAAGEVCKWPEYSRKLHDPIEDAVIIDRDVVLIEGNYLLLDEPGWRDLRNYADYTIKLNAKEEDLRQRLIDRKKAAGASPSEAMAHVEFSDLRNVRLCLAHSFPAELELSPA